MKFEFYDREFDTEKPICVLGYVIKKQFSIYRKHDEFDRNCIRQYGPKIKKFYVNSMNFKLIDGVNVVINMKLITPKRNDGAYIDTGNIIGHSPQECLKLYKAMQKVRNV
ncbi:MAG: hypothetical protein Q4G33_06395 [bacterium]|nr:hypothetical protein [bacterium]